MDVREAGRDIVVGLQSWPSSISSKIFLRLIETYYVLLTWDDYRILLREIVDLLEEKSFKKHPTYSIFYGQIRWVFGTINHEYSQLLSGLKRLLGSNLTPIRPRVAKSSQGTVYFGLFCSILLLNQPVQAAHAGSAASLVRLDNSQLASRQQMNLAQCPAIETNISVAFYSRNTHSSPVSDSVPPQVCKESDSALHCFIRLGSQASAQELIQRGGQLDLFNEDNVSPLQLAMQQHEFEIARFILEHDRGRPFSPNEWRSFEAAMQLMSSGSMPEPAKLIVRIDQLAKTINPRSQQEKEFVGYFYFQSAKAIGANRDSDQYTKAQLTFLERALQSTSLRKSPLLHCGDFLLNDRKPERALVIMEQYRGALNTDPDVELLYAKILYSNYYLLDAIERLQPLSAEYPADKRFQLELAWLLADTLQYDKALYVCQHLLTQQAAFKLTSKELREVQETRELVLRNKANLPKVMTKRSLPAHPGHQVVFNSSAPKLTSRFFDLASHFDVAKFCFGRRYKRQKVVELTKLLEDCYYKDEMVFYSNRMIDAIEFLWTKLPDGDHFLNYVHSQLYYMKSAIFFRKNYLLLEAKALMEQSAALYPLPPEGIHQYSEINYRLGNYDLAYLAARKVSLLNGDKPLYWKRALNKLVELKISPFMVDAKFPQDYNEMSPMEVDYFGPVISAKRKGVQSTPADTWSFSPWSTIFAISGLITAFFLPRKIYVRRVETEDHEQPKKRTRKPGIGLEDEKVRQLLLCIEPMFTIKIEHRGSLVIVRYGIKELLPISEVDSKFLDISNLDGLASCSIDEDSCLSQFQKNMGAFAGGVSNTLEVSSISDLGQLESMLQAFCAAAYKDIIEKSAEYTVYSRDLALKAARNRLGELNTAHQQLPLSTLDLDDIRSTKTRAERARDAQSSPDFGVVRIKAEFYDNIIQTASSILTDCVELKSRHAEIEEKLQAVAALLEDFKKNNSQIDPRTKEIHTLIRSYSKLHDGLQKRLDALKRLILSAEAAFEKQRQFVDAGNKKKKQKKPERPKESEAEKSRRKEKFKSDKAERKTQRELELQAKQAEEAKKLELAAKMVRTSALVDRIGSLVGDVRTQGVRASLDCLHATLEEQAEQYTVPGAINSYLSDRGNQAEFTRLISPEQVGGQPVNAWLLKNITHDSLIACQTRIFEGLRQLLVKNPGQLAFFADFRMIDAIRHNLVHRTHLAHNRFDEFVVSSKIVYEYFQPILQNLVTNSEFGGASFPISVFSELLIVKAMSEIQDKQPKDPRFHLSRIVMLCYRLRIYAGVAREIEKKSLESYMAPNALHQAMTSVIEQIGEHLTVLAQTNNGFRNQLTRPFITARNRIDHQFEEEGSTYAPGSDLFIFEPIPPHQLYALADNAMRIACEYGWSSGALAAASSSSSSASSSSFRWQ